MDSFVCMLHTVRRRVHQVRGSVQTAIQHRAVRGGLPGDARGAAVRSKSDHPWHSRGLRNAPAQPSLTAHAFLNTPEESTVRDLAKGAAVRTQERGVQDSVHNHLTTKTVCKMTKAVTVTSPT